MAKQASGPEPLQAVEAEEALLGALLIDPDAMLRVSTRVSPMDFWRPQHKWVYTAILRMHESQAAIDIMTVADYLENQGYLEKVGGGAFLTKLSLQTPTSIHADTYAEMVVDMSRRRQLVDAAARIAGIAYDKSKPLDDVLAEADKIFFESTATMVDDEMLDAGQLMSGLYDQVETSMKRKGMIGVTTGFADVDTLLGGLHKGDLVYLAARPSVGKTATLLNVALAAAKSGKRVLFVSLEMSDDQVAQRLACIESGLNTRKLRQGEIEDAEFLRLMDAMGRISGLPLHVIWTGTKDPAELRATARKMQAEIGIDLLCIDYLQLMSADHERGQNRREQVDSISRSLKLLAKALKIPVIANAQLSRAVEQRTDKRPVLSDLRESGGLEQDADIVAFLYRHDMYEPEDESTKGLMEWIVGKNRNGPIGTCILHFRPWSNQVVGTRVAKTEGGLQIRMPLETAQE